MGTLIYAQTFSQIVNNIPNSYIYKISKNNILLQKEALNKTKSQNYGKIEAEYNAVRFFNQPVMKIDSMQPVAVDPNTNLLIYKEVHSTLPMGDKNHYIFQLKYSYPIFTGFAISNSIKKAKLEFIKSKLKFQNTKRELILNAAKLYAAIYALNEEIKALQFAKNALFLAKEKVKALFDEGLVDSSNVSEIEAKYYEIVAKIEKQKSQKTTLLNSLNELLNTDIKDISSLEKIDIKNCDVTKRADIKEVYKTLQIAQLQEKLAKSSFYPKVGLEIAFKREGDNIFVTKNRYQNIDSSYIALGIKWDFSGKNRAELKMAKIAKMNALLFYKNYLNKARNELKNDFVLLKALRTELKSAVSEEKARESYYKKIKAKFDEGLVDSVALSDAIAKFSTAKAKKEYIKSQIFFYNVKTNLDGGNLNLFKR